MPETLNLTDGIDTPGLNTIAVYEERGGYAAARKALTEMTPEAVLEQLEARACADAAAPASRWARRPRSSLRAR